jgi:hypothetical protein
MQPRVIHAQALSDTVVEVSFTTGETGRLDVTPWLAYPAFAPLRDPGLFRRAHAAHGTVVWTDEIDLCPDTVWAEAVRR